MATKLEGDVLRESSVITDERNIMITLTSEQKIKMKLKGMKSGEVEISIVDLYNLLTKKTIKIEKDEKTSVVIDNKPANITDKSLISLYDFRSQYLISKEFDLPTKCKLEAITVNLLSKR